MRQPIVALPADALPEGACGLITFWRLSGGIEADALREAWTGAGLDETWLPPELTPATALKRALDEIDFRTSKSDDARYLVRPVEAGAERHVVRERAVLADGATGDKDLEHETVFRAKLTSAGALRLTGASHLSLAVRGAFNAALFTLAERDLSGWLPRIVARLDAVPLRTGGGIYFVPPAHVPTWQRVRGVLAAVSECSVEWIPAMRGPDAARAILANVVEDAKTRIAAIVEDLERENLSLRGAESHKAELDDLAARVARYETLLGDVAAGFKEVLEDGELAVASAHARIGGAS